MVRELTKAWAGFREGSWCRGRVDVRDFIQNNYSPYTGDSSFLSEPTAATKKLWEDISELSAREREAGGVLDMDTDTVS
ncbi:MAG: formate acetyltransferase, partial [Candidatus Ornithomonoglobus sp.]